MSDVGEDEGSIVCSSVDGEDEGSIVSPLVGARVGSVGKVSISVGACVVLAGGGSPSSSGSVQNMTRSTTWMIPAMPWVAGSLARPTVTPKPRSAATGEITMQALSGMPHEQARNAGDAADVAQGR